MNLRGVLSTVPVTPVSLASSDVPAPAGPSGSSGNAVQTLIQLDPVTQQPVPPRFPWLSRLTLELEKAGAPVAPFGTPANLGNRLDKLA